MISGRLAAFGHELSLANVPAAVRTRAAHLALDAIGCGFAARAEPFAARIEAAVARLAGVGPRVVLGARGRLPLRDAALVNGALMHGLDYDDTHADGIVHLTVSTFPAALAVAADVGASGAELLAAYIIGVETGARLAAAAKGAFHQAGFHPTGVIGAFASALVAGRLMRLSGERLVAAQGIALSFASGSLQFLEDGSWTKRLHPGWAAASGISAAALAAGELPAPREAYEGRFGLYRTYLAPAQFANCDLARATAGLGETWEIDHVALKPYPACHLLHGCIDAAIELHREGIEPQRVRAVRALVPAGVVEAVCEPLAAKRRPKTDYEAKFSLPYAVASGLARGRLGTAELAPAALAESALVRLMDRIDYAVDPRADFPRHYSGELAVTLEDGHTLARRVEVNRGNPERPLTNAEIEAKFFENCTAAIVEAKARRIRDAVLALESLPSAREFETLLAA